MHIISEIILTLNSHYITSGLSAEIKTIQTMNKACFLNLLFLFMTVQLFAQETFDPNKKLAELSGDKKNIGITAGYSVGGELKWSNAAGYLCKDDETPFSTTTLTRIASISKNFTAVAVMQLVEQNLIELDTPIEVYLSDLPADKKQLTVRQLMAHTAGISQYQGEDEIENTIHYNSLNEAMNVFIQRPLLFEPGSKYFYTTYGYVILGRIIEAVSSLPYQEYMKKHIFDPVGMKNTVIEEINEKYPNRSCLYHKGRRKAKKGKQNDLSNRIPGGGYLSTLEDLIIFGNAMIDDKLISRESFDLMLEIQPVEYDGNKYGLGWFMYGPHPNENVVIGHSGGQTGCTSQLMIVPRSKTVVVVLSNTSGHYPDIVTFASSLIGLSESSRE
jgi:CubicO group peptidase (beta-lactamase class C family)